ncbi:MAG: amino acid permease [Thaumarchaeota archaeon]|nr:amino acid permease [Candidatus Calditenuaceae archaeon]MDW8187586.1 amino acid permease [Nitrososphaerota archaeon]
MGADVLMVEERGSLKREVGWFGSFAMGYGDVGADIFIALGVTMLYAGGAAPLAFLIGSIAYVAIALCYGELAPAYPYAGGVQVYSLRAWNTLLSFIAGWALMLDYLLCISLFATASAGYLHFILPQLTALSLDLGLIELNSLGMTSALLVAILLALNYIGIKYSAWLISSVVAFSIAVQSLIFLIGYLTSFDLELFLKQVQKFGSGEILPEVEYVSLFDVHTNNFLYGVTIAMASFIGVESIAQAAEETRSPHRWIPRAAKLAALAVPLSVLLMSVLALGVTEIDTVIDSIENPVAALVNEFKFFGEEMALIVALTAMIMSLASSNTGVIGVSRLTASMGKHSLLPQWLYRVHPKFGTPHRTILLFGGIGLFLTLPGDIPLLASLYNFGALIGYLILLLSVIALRQSERNVYRPWQLRPSFSFRWGGKEFTVPLLVAIGLVTTCGIFALYLMLHPLGRIMGGVWMVVGILGYALYRRRALRSAVIDTSERELVIPAGYRMSLTVFVRPYENPDHVVKTLTSYTDTRFDIKLVSVLETEMAGEVALDSENVARELERIASKLRSKGYVVKYEVRVGDFEESAVEELTSGTADFVVYLVRGFEKASVLKSSAHSSKIHSVLTKFPGRVVLLKKTV